MKYIHTDLLPEEYLHLWEVCFSPAGRMIIYTYLPHLEDSLLLVVHTHRTRRLQLLLKVDLNTLHRNTAASTKSVTEVLFKVIYYLSQSSGASQRAVETERKIRSCEIKEAGIRTDTSSLFRRHWFKPPQTVQFNSNVKRKAKKTTTNNVQPVQVELKAWLRREGEKRVDTDLFREKFKY